MKIRLLPMLFVLLLSLAVAQGAKAPVMRISGSTSMVNLTRRLTSWYSERNAGIEFHVDGTNPTQGFSSLISGDAAIVQSSRKALGGEVLALRTRRKLEFVEIPVATEFAVIAVNAGNPLHSTSIYDLRQILSGRVKNWKELGGPDAPIRLYGRDQYSEVRNLLDEEIMGDASFAESATLLSTNAAVLSAVAGDPLALAFCDVDLHPQANVRLLGIKQSTNAEAIEPTGDNLRAHRYVLSRTLYFYFAGKPQGELGKFAEWVLTSEGQLVVEAVGLYPLGAADREMARARLKKP